jgi:hypothetical protein
MCCRGPTRMTQDRVTGVGLPVLFEPARQGHFSDGTPTRKPLALGASFDFDERWRS